MDEIERMAKRQTFFNTPWNERGAAERVLVITGTIGAIVGGVVLVRRTVEAIKTRREQQMVDKDEQTFQNKGQKLTYPLSQYLIFADTLYQSMKGSGTYEEEVAGVFYKMRNDLDILQLNRAFGKKDGYSLSEWIADDFSEEDKAYYINNILAKKKIKFRF